MIACGALMFLFVLMTTMHYLFEIKAPRKFRGTDITDSNGYFAKGIILINIPITIVAVMFITVGYLFLE